MARRSICDRTTHAGAVSRPLLGPRARRFFRPGPATAGGSPLGFSQAPAETHRRSTDARSQCARRAGVHRLWLFTHEERYQKAAQQTLDAFAAHAPDYGPFAAGYALALCYHLHPPVAAIIIGNPEREDTRRLHTAALSVYRPGRQVAVFSPEARDLPYPAAPDGSALAYICAGQTCASPTGDRRESEAFAAGFRETEYCDGIVLTGSARVLACPANLPGEIRRRDFIPPGTRGRVRSQ